MKLSEMIKTLQNAQGAYGDIQVNLMNDVPVGIPPNDVLRSTEVIFIVPELYESDDEHKEQYWIVNIRSWPY